MKCETCGHEYEGTHSRAEQRESKAGGFALFHYCVHLHFDGGTFRSKHDATSFVKAQYRAS